MLSAVSGLPTSASAAALTGRPLTAETIGAAAELAAQAARPRTDHRGSAEYKRHMVRTFVERILVNAGTGSPGAGQGGDPAERAA